MHTIEELGRKLRAGYTTSAEITRECLARIDADNARLNAFILVLREEAERQAHEADRELQAGRDRGALHGIPVSVKDLFDMRGLPTTAASRVREGHVAEHDASAIARLRHAGAVIVGKTNLHEFAFGTTNEDSAFGPARNPIDERRSPGGSSGGSAASVAAGMAIASLGTDTGGSIRIPAAACGIVGLKPTFDELPVDGVVPLSRTFDHAGPLAASVTDAWHVFQALLGRDAGRPLAPPPPGALKIAVPRPYFCDILDVEVQQRFEEALDALRRAGAQVLDTAIPHAALIVPVYMHVSFGDAAAYHATTLETMADKYTVPVRLRLEVARTVLAEDYVRGLEGRNVLRREVDAALSGCDCLALPTLPIPPPLIGSSSTAIGGSSHPVRALTLRLTQLFNITGHPAISLPMGRTSEGLPAGLQLVGARSHTETLVRNALAVEAVIR